MADELEAGWGAITHTCAILKVCGKVSYFLVFLVWSRSFWGSTTALLDPTCRSQLTKHPIKPPGYWSVWFTHNGQCGSHTLFTGFCGWHILVSVVDIYWSVWGRNRLYYNLLQCPGLLCITDYRSFCSLTFSFLARCQNTPFSFSLFIKPPSSLLTHVCIFVRSWCFRKRAEFFHSAAAAAAGKIKVHPLSLMLVFFLGLWSHLV